MGAPGRLKSPGLAAIALPSAGHQFGELALAIARGFGAALPADVAAVGGGDFHHRPRADAQDAPTPIAARVQDHGIRAQRSANLHERLGHARRGKRSEIQSRLFLIRYVASMLRPSFRFKGAEAPFPLQRV
ncbi:MAG: hypothetical protein WD118_00340 [Phycisphaeraceae bacterium]